MKLWQCRECGQERMGRERPKPTHYWNDHKCKFSTREEIERLRNRPKGFNLLGKEKTK